MPRGHLRTGVSAVHSHEYMRHTGLSAVYVRPFLVTLYIIPMTLSKVAVSVKPMFPSPRRMTVFPSLRIILCMR